MERFARRLASKRLEKGLNLSETAKSLGVARTAYRLWEKGAAAPSIEHFKSIALWCEVPLATILADLGLLSRSEEKELLRLAAVRLEEQI